MMIKQTNFKSANSISKFFAKHFGEFNLSTNFTFLISDINPLHAPRTHAQDELLPETVWDLKFSQNSKKGGWVLLLRNFSQKGQTVFFHIK